MVFMVFRRSLAKVREKLRRKKSSKATTHVRKRSVRKKASKKRR